MNGGAWTSASGTVNSGDTLQVRTTSSWSPALADGVYLSVGDYGVNFLVVTMDSLLGSGQDVVLSDGHHYKSTT